MTKIQREELDFEIKHIDHSHEWHTFNRRVTDATPWAKWFMAGLALAIAVIIGAQIIFHLIAWSHL